MKRMRLCIILLQNQNSRSPNKVTTHPDIRMSQPVVQASGCSFDSAPSLGTPMCHRCGPKKKKGEKKKSKRKRKKFTAKMVVTVFINSGLYKPSDNLNSLNKQTEKKKTLHIGF